MSERDEEPTTASKDPPATQDELVDSLLARPANILFEQDDPTGHTVYYIGKKLGEGSFGVLYEGVKATKNDQLKPSDVAIKFEPLRIPIPLLRDEFRVYQQLAGCAGIPVAHAFRRNRLHNILIVDLLGPSLEDLFKKCGGRFTVRTVLMLAPQMISLLEGIHGRHFIHGDIKPDNILIGRSRSDWSNFYLIDFGLAKRFRDPKTMQHIPFREHESLTGNLRYASTKATFGGEQSRRDDLEGLGHVFLYFLRGRLPWQGLKDREKVGKIKQTFPIQQLVRGFPKEFGEYMAYVRSLGFEDDPDYNYLRGLFAKALENRGETNDGRYDWMNGEQDEIVSDLDAAARGPAQQLKLAVPIVLRERDK